MARRVSGAISRSPTFLRAAEGLGRRRNAELVARPEEDRATGAQLSGILDAPECEPCGDLRGVRVDLDTSDIAEGHGEVEHSLSGQRHRPWRWESVNQHERLAGPSLGPSVH